MSWMVINLLNTFNNFFIYFHSNLDIELVLTLCCTRRWFLRPLSPSLVICFLVRVIDKPLRRRVQSQVFEWGICCWLSGAERTLLPVLPPLPPATVIQLQLLIHSPVIWHVGMLTMKPVRSHSSTEIESHTTATINFLHWTSLFPTVDVVVHVINIVCRSLQDSAKNILHMVFMTENVVARKIRITQLT